MFNPQTCAASVVERNHDVHLGLARIPEFGKGIIVLTAEDATTSLRELANAMADDPKVPCLPTIGFTLASLTSLWSRAYVSRGVLTGDAGARYVAQLQNTQMEAWRLHINVRANFGNAEVKTADAVHDLFNQLSDIWHRCGHRGKMFTIQAGSTVSEYFAIQRVRNTFQEFSDLVVETLRARFEGAGRATPALRDLLGSLLAYWRSLIIRTYDPTALAHLQEGLSFRLGGITALMRSLQPRLENGKVLATFSQIVDGLAKSQAAPLDWMKKLRSVPGQKDSLDRACRELRRWADETAGKDGKSLRRLRRDYCPFLQGREQRLERIPLQIDGSVKLPTPEPSLQAKVIDVNDPVHNRVKLEALKQFLPKLAPGERLNVSFQYPATHSQYTDKAKDIPCKVTRPCEPAEVEGTDQRGLVVELDSVWVDEQKNGWQSFVNSKRTA